MVNPEIVTNKFQPDFDIVFGINIASLIAFISSFLVLYFFVYFCLKRITFNYRIFVLSVWLWQFYE